MPKIRELLSLHDFCASFHILPKALSILFPNGKGSHIKEEREKDQKDKSHCIINPVPKSVSQKMIYELLSKRKGEGKEKGKKTKAQHPTEKRKRIGMKAIENHGCIHLFFSLRHFQ